MAKVTGIGGLLLVVLAAGCGPSYVSGKTQCATGDAGARCPSGFMCGNDGTSDANYCYDVNCNPTKPFYCKNANTCFDREVACSSVVNCGTSTQPSYFACSSPSYRYDCATNSCVATAGDGGAGGAGGKIDGGSGVVCGATTCSAGQSCFNSQCCATPAAGGVCNHYPACGCPSGQVCYPNSTQHTMTCMAGANLAEGADCRSSSCPAGLGCFGGVCKRYCNTEADCPLVAGLAECLPTVWSDTGADIEGVKVCGRICDPVNPQNPRAPLVACPAGFVCSSYTDGKSWCIAPTTPSSSTCTKMAECAPGKYCTQSGTCNKYCYTNADCPSGQTCNLYGFNPAQMAGTYTVGYCTTGA